MAKRNPFFKFRQFTVFHDKCAMKVGTDGSMLGAWTDTSNAQFALDIGTGSGVLALMIAQKNEKLLVDAIDIDNGAIEQAEINIQNSPFANRINCIQTSIQDYHPDKKYDLIISNPPYFVETLKSPNQQRAIARHADSLPAQELIQHASFLLNKNGRLSLIYPYSYKSELQSLAEQFGFYISRITNVFPTPESEPKRILIELSKKEAITVENDLIIETERYVYSDDFKTLVKDFYINRV